MNDELRTQILSVRDGDVIVIAGGNMTRAATDELLGHLRDTGRKNCVVLCLPAGAAVNVLRPEEADSVLAVAVLAEETT